MLNNFFGKSVFFEETAKNCSGSPFWGAQAAITYPNSIRVGQKLLHTGL